MPGHRVLADIQLLPTEEGGLGTAVEEGNRSLVLVFRDGGGEVRLGGVVENIDGSAQPGRRFRAEVWFWNELAARHATAQASFDLWYRRVVGSGTVLHVMSAS